MKKRQLHSAALSDIGKVRETNEDSCFCMDEWGVYCVADGMGGVAGGAQASEAIVSNFRETFGKAISEEPDTLSALIAMATSAVENAGEWIKSFAIETMLGQMGSTVVALVFDPNNPNRAVCLHAGDSRLYRHRNNELQVLTTDHSASTALAKKLGRDPASLPARFQNELVRFIGAGQPDELEQTSVEVCGGDLFLLCSDGLTHMLPDKEIARTLRRADRGSLQAAARTLVDRANQAGGKDNTTVVIIHVNDTTSPGAHKPTVQPALCTAVVPCADSEATVSQTHPDDQSVTSFETAGKADAETLFLQKTLSAQREDGQKTQSSPNDQRSVRWTIVVLAVVMVAWLGLVLWSDPRRDHTTTGPDGVAVEEALRSTLKEAETAYAAREFKVAQAKAQEALGLAPDSPAAKRLLVAALRQLTIAARDRDYLATLTAAQQALDRQDYTSAITKSHEAMGLKPDAVPARMVRDEARKQLRIIAKRERKFQTVMRTAQEALKKNEYMAAAQKAMEALELKPKHRLASRVRDQAHLQLELADARACFAQGSYEKAAEICAAHPDSALFTQLAGRIAFEQRELATAQTQFDSGEYSFIAELRGQGHASKPPFLNLLKKAEPEYELLKRLDGSAEKANAWQIIRSILADPTVAGLTNKPPFSDRWAWCQSEFEKERMKRRKLEELDTIFHILLVQFSVKGPTDDYITTLEARHKLPLPRGQTTESQRRSLVSKVDWLTMQYRDNRALSQNQRRELLRTLKTEVLLFW